MFSERSNRNTTRQWALGSLAVLVVCAFAAALISRSGESARVADSTGTQEILPFAFNREPIEPLPQRLDLNPEVVALGKRLFSDPRLSHDNTVSCAFCHDLSKGGVDGLKHARGIGGATGVVNTPTVFNSGFGFRQFWDGRAATLEEQVGGPIQNPIEMASSWPEVLGKLGSDATYVKEFAALYPDGLKSRNVQNAIAVFERSLITPDSPFDRYLRGERSALGKQELAGYQLFKERGCSACHQGVNVGGNMYQSLGVFGNYFADRGKDAKEDQGRFNVTGREADRHVFKVPSLRNVALTAPYFHDGSVARLDEAVRIMSKYQLGSELSRQEIDQVVAFLHSLTGSYQGKPL